MLDHLSGNDTDVIVLEVADGLHQADTVKLITSKTFAINVDGVIFAAMELRIRGLQKTVQYAFI